MVNIKSNMLVSYFHKELCFVEINVSLPVEDQDDDISHDNVECFNENQKGILSIYLII